MRFGDISNISSFTTNPVVSGGRVNDGSLQDVLASCVCDLDATLSASYGGTGQTWSNIVAIPGDGASQTDYDRFLGLDGSVASDDPTFTGTAGNNAAYFAHDGADHFNQKVVVGSTPTLAKAHRTDTAGTWVAIAFRTPVAPSGFVRLWGNTAATPDLGMVGQYDSAEQMELTQIGDSSNATLIVNGTSVVGNTEYLAIFSWDGTSSTSNAKIWLNSNTATDTGSVALNTSTTDATIKYLAGATFNAGSPIQPLDADSRMYGFYVGQEFLDDTKAAIIITALNARHNRTYA